MEPYSDVSYQQLRTICAQQPRKPDSTTSCVEGKENLELENLGSDIESLHTEHSIGRKKILITFPLSLYQQGNG